MSLSKSLRYVKCLYPGTRIPNSKVYKNVHMFEIVCAPIWTVHLQSCGRRKKDTELNGRKHPPTFICSWFPSECRPNIDFLLWCQKYFKFAQIIERSTFVLRLFLVFWWRDMIISTICLLSLLPKNSFTSDWVSVFLNGKASVPGKARGFTASVV